VPKPKEIAMTLRKTVLAAASALAFISAAHADGLRPIEAQSISLGEMHGVAYYTVEPDGFRVVATMAQGEAGTPMRLEAVLGPGQSVVLSIPWDVGAASRSIEFSRLNDQVLVAAAATN
jgi:hypothetical protein